MLDSDIVVEPDLCARLVQKMYQYDLDVVTGLYCYKGGSELSGFYTCGTERTKNTKSLRSGIVRRLV